MLDVKDKQKVVLGKVVRKSGDKTIYVDVERRYQHAVYRKFVSQRSTYCVHDDANVAKLGDKVHIASCAPISKTKSWKLVEKI